MSLIKKAVVYGGVGGIIYEFLVYVLVGLSGGSISGDTFLGSLQLLFTLPYISAWLNPILWCNPLDIDANPLRLLCSNDIYKLAQFIILQMTLVFEGVIFAWVIFQIRLLRKR